MWVFRQVSREKQKVSSHAPLFMWSFVVEPRKNVAPPPRGWMLLHHTSRLTHSNGRIPYSRIDWFPVIGHTTGYGQIWKPACALQVQRARRRCFRFFAMTFDETASSNREANWRHWHRVHCSLLPSSLFPGIVDIWIIPKTYYSTIWESFFH